jgi:hypothetical protein
LNETSISERSNMHGKKIVPILLAFGALHLMLRRHRFELAAQRGDGEYHDPRRKWVKRVPPILEQWHQRLHEAQPSSSSPAV